MCKYLIALLGTLAWTAVASAQPTTCKKPQMLIILDKSSSMVTGSVGGQTKWAVAKTALSSVLNTYQSSVDFGLMIFPNPNQCGPGSVKVEIGSNNAQAIISALGDPPPDAGNYTPMAQSLDVAATLQSLQEAGVNNNVLLITDGWQWCDGYDSSHRFLPVNSTTNLTDLEITTYIVGFGNSVDALTLNKMAAVANTKINASCDVTSSDHLATNNCYYQANDPQQLINALQNVATLVTAEQCDGLDNNCDGNVDEGLNRSCSSACGTGMETCSKGNWIGCSASQPSEEICDGIDNDCNNTIDDGCPCIDGTVQACGIDKGECRQGTQTCKAGVLGDCVGQLKAAVEICDGKDNDCDGIADEDLTRTCKTICGGGMETCIKGQYTDCTAQLPSEEVCDGLDNDCDNEIDGVNATCSNGGVCSNGTCQVQGIVETDSGCDCTVSKGPAPMGLGLLLACFVLLLGRRFRQGR